jgi:hypothetical protein
MTRTRISFIASTALASIHGAALPALAQAPIAPAPGTEAAVVPAAPLMGPRSSDDLTGSVGFGTGVTSGTNTLIAPTDTLILKYWISDVLAVVPSLGLGITKANVGPTGWNLSPQALVAFVPWKSTSTRLSVGAGLGLSLHKNFYTTAGDPNSDTANAHIGIFIPIQAGVEHFFTRWFSMGIALNTRFFDYSKDGSNYTMKFFNIDSGASTNFLASLMFYTD